MWWRLMDDAITESDKLKLIEFISSTNMYTCGKKVEEFEDAWSKWIGCKHSLFVTSGSTANSLLISSVKEHYNIPDGSKVLVPACTWVTNVSPVFQNNLEPVFCDINLDNYSFDMDNLPTDTDIRIVFITHLLGLNAPVEALKERYPNAIFLEDICESHGVKDCNGKRRGTGTGSTFSFYYGHHMTTIEGGMVCTDNKELYELMRLKRSHGMAKHLLPENYDSVVSKYPHINPKFLFLTDGHNFRNTELNAVIGLEQLKRLDNNIHIRRNNYDHFMNRLSSLRDMFHVPMYDKFNSSFTLPFVCKTREQRNTLINVLDDLSIESRPIVAGNLLVHPFLSKWKDTVETPNATILNDNGVYIGNNQSITIDMIDTLFDTIKDKMYDSLPVTKYNDKVAMVTGANGQDGSYLIEFLLEKGYTVHAMKRRSSCSNTQRIDHIISSKYKDSGKFVIHYGDVCDLSSMIDIVKEVRPSELYNLAAQSHVAVSFKVPLYTAEVDGMGTMNVLEAVRLTGQTKTCRVYQASTSELYGKVQQIPQTENTPFYPRSPYGVSKLMGYWAVVNYRESYGMYACNGILFNHESPRRGENFVTRKITMGLANIKKGKQECLYLGNLDAKRDWGHARDYVECMWKMLQQDEPEDYVIATGETITVRDFATHAFKCANIDLDFRGSGLDEVGVDRKTGKILIRVDKSFFRPAEVDQLVGDPSKAIRQLNWNPRKTDFNDLVREMVESDMSQ
jgi:GDP-mannose 4,6-dehydratase